MCIDMAFEDGGIRDAECQLPRVSVHLTQESSIEGPDHEAIEFTAEQIIGVLRAEGQCEDR